VVLVWYFLPSTKCGTKKSEMVVQRLVVYVEVSDSRYHGKRLNKEQGNIGTHTLRKKGYLFAICGILKLCVYSAGPSMDKDGKSVADLAFANVLLSTRHATRSKSSVYQRNVTTQFAFLKHSKFLTDH
jgi:hypothetical protein